MFTYRLPLALLAALLFSACSSQPRQQDQPATPATTTPARAAKPIVVGSPAVEELAVGARLHTIDLTIPPNNLWQRIRNGFGMPDLHGPLVADRQAWYLNNPAQLKRIMARSSKYLYYIVEELERRGMPTELALLPMVESAFNPMAASRSRALGMWQFIPSTGRNFKLDQNYWRDERRDVIASTTAALDYLESIYEMNGDWHLALASYNWGENAVARAVAKNRAQGLPTDYENLPMPTETRYYVPKLQALKNIVAQPELFGFSLDPLPNQPYFDTVDLPGDMDVMLAAKLAEMPVDEFIALNPAYHRPLIRGGDSTQLLLPTDKVRVFRTNLARYEAQDKPLANWRTYRLKKGETLERVAARHKLSADKLKQLNGITGRVKARPGFNLLVPGPGAQISEQLAAALPSSPIQSEAAPKAITASKTVKASKTGKSARANKRGNKHSSAKGKSRAKPAGKPVKSRKKR